MKTITNQLLVLAIALCAAATLTSCGVNKSIDRRADGSPAEAPVPYYNFVGALKQAGGEWRVTVADVRGDKGCRA